jgi:DNA-binding MarR family transcriptional regulator/N-acetylglutamate synthase-like GNAT family acetyltransferase
LVSPPRIAALRRFNRFYTQKIGVLRDGLLGSPFSLAEARVLYELAHRQKPTAAELAAELGLDAGYLSRILRGFEKRRLIERTRSSSDGRESLISLTASGKRAFAPLDARSREEIALLLRDLSDGEQRRLVDAARTIETLLDGNREQTPYLLRPHQPGDMGWVVHRHGALYAREYGWDERFEALVAGIVAKFIEDFSPKRERCWIAERDGEIIGSVFLVERSKTLAQLRMLLVEPKARGLGLGSRLVEECIRFARLAGYRKIELWTNDILHAARRIYERAGFQLVREERHHSFGKDLVGQTWDLKL